MNDSEKWQRILQLIESLRGNLHSCRNSFNYIDYCLKWGTIYIKLHVSSKRPVGKCQILMLFHQYYEALNKG